MLCRTAFLLKSIVAGLLERGKVLLSRAMALSCRQPGPPDSIHGCILKPLDPSGEGNFAHEEPEVAVREGESPLE